MSEAQDICIRNARLRHKGDERVDIAISGDRITAVGKTVQGKAELELDARGSLVTPPFANPHMHLCKVYTLPMMDELALKYYHEGGMGKAMNAVEVAAKVKKDYDRKWIIPNARRALALAALHGVLYIRVFADVDRLARQEGLAALLALARGVQGHPAGTGDGLC